jgi:hypothetical protein
MMNFFLSNLDGYSLRSPDRKQDRISYLEELSGSYENDDSQQAIEELPVGLLEITIWI